MKEKWKAIPGYEGYEASNLGRVRSFRNSRWGLTEKPYVLKASKSPKGYMTLYPMVNGKQKTKAVHRMVAEAWVENKSAKPCINHIDGNKSNNLPFNLEWCTIQENNAHSMATGLHRSFRGERAPCVKLTKKQVLTIRNEAKKIYLGFYRDMGKKYKVSWATIRAVVIRKTWKHI